MLGSFMGWDGWDGVGELKCAGVYVNGHIILFGDFRLDFLFASFV